VSKWRLLKFDGKLHYLSEDSYKRALEGLRKKQTPYVSEGQLKWKDTEKIPFEPYPEEKFFEGDYTDIELIPLDSNISLSHGVPATRTKDGDEIVDTRIHEGEMLIRVRDEDTGEEAWYPINDIEMSGDIELDIEL